jgi:hypothetical protein
VEAGAQNNDVVTYGIRDGSESEIGRGTFTSGSSLSRDTVLKSTNGDNKLDLSGNEEVYITAAAEDISLPLTKTVYAIADDTHTGNNTWEDINSMSVTLIPPDIAELFCIFTCQVSPISSNWEHFSFRFLLDGATASESYTQSKNSAPSGSPRFIINIHAVFSSVSKASHTIKAQWHDNNSSQDVTIYQRRLTVMACRVS